MPTLPCSAPPSHSRMRLRSDAGTPAPSSPPQHLRSTSVPGAEHSAGDVAAAVAGAVRIQGLTSCFLLVRSGTTRCPPASGAGLGSRDSPLPAGHRVGPRVPAGTCRRLLQGSPQGWYQPAAPGAPGGVCSDPPVPLLLGQIRVVTRGLVTSYLLGADCTYPVPAPKRALERMNRKVLRPRQSPRGSASGRGGRLRWSRAERGGGRPHATAPAQRGGALHRGISSFCSELVLQPPRKRFTFQMWKPTSPRAESGVKFS